MQIACLKDKMKSQEWVRIPCWGSFLDPAVASLRQGYNATVLAYGQTGLRFHVGLFTPFCKQQLGRLGWYTPKLGQPPAILESWSVSPPFLCEGAAAVPDNAVARLWKDPYHGHWSVSG